MERKLYRQQFLAQRDVIDFVAWLGNNLSRIPVHLKFSRSRFVRQGIDQCVKGIEAVQAAYQWQASWTDFQTGKVVESGDWHSTQQSLSLLRGRLRTALANGCEASTYQSCLGVLQWGGVRGAIPFLDGLRHQSGLVKYLEDSRELFALDGSQKLSDLDGQKIRRFDAGLTKIHSLLDVSGSPIYDSRVGAAIAMLYALYRQGATCRAVLNFPSGQARGEQIRDPGAFGFRGAPQFFTKTVTPQRWAQCQVELGWIIQETLAANDWFSGSLAERCHVFEAALFMLGYDLRCFRDVSAERVTKNLVDTQVPEAFVGGTSRSTWVPTSVPFAQVLREYLECSLFAGHGVELAVYRQWQITQMGRTSSTAMAYCSPLRPNELDLPSYSIGSLDLIAQGGKAGLRALFGEQLCFIAGDEREQVYLVDAFLAAHAMRLAGKRNAQCQLLIDCGFAGGEGSANVLLHVGRSVGRHFGLLDGNERTQLFNDFYGDALIDLEHKLSEAAR